MRASIIILAMTMSLNLGGCATESKVDLPPLPIYDVSELIAHKDQIHGDFILKAYVFLAAFDKVGGQRTIFESKAIFDKAARVDRSTQPDDRREADRLWNNYCLNIWDINPLFRSGRMINRREVTLRARLYDTNGLVLLSSCRQGLAVGIVEVLDPPARAARLPEP